MRDKKKTEVGIITIHFPYNYGAMLQAYATQQFLDKKNIHNEIVDFRPYEIDKDYHIRFEMLKEKPKLFLHMCLGKLLGKRKRYRRFENFLKKEMRLSTKRYKSITDKDALAYSVLVAGSDQIWNPDIMHGRYEYALDFGNDIKKVSYASSFGKDTINKEISEKLKARFEKFASLSTREKQGIEILKNMGIEKAVKVCDPVFLLSQKEWERIESSDVNIKEKYVLLYSLQNNEEMNTNIQKIAEAYHYKVVSIHPTGVIKDFADINISDIGPKEFIYLIHNAEYVFSNSFHAAAFSIIFDKKLYAFLHSKTGSRVRNLLEQFEMVKCRDSVINCEYYTAGEMTEKRIHELVEYSKQYFIQALE